MRWKRTGLKTKRASNALYGAFAYRRGLCLDVCAYSKGHSVIETDTLLKSTGHRVDITLEDAYIAALLHDAIEDQGGAEMKARIRQRFDQAAFGPVVSELVDYCTTHDPPDGAPPIDYNAKKRAQLIRVAYEAPQTATLIAACDKLANIRDTVQEYAEEGDRFWEKFKVSRAQKLRYIDDIAEVFTACGRVPQVANEISQTVRRLKRLIRRNENPIVRLWRRWVILPLQKAYQQASQKMLHRLRGLRGAPASAEPALGL